MLATAIVGLTFLMTSVPVRHQGNLARFEHFTVEDGLCNSTVLSILQDRDGYLWFATEDGINRFDGVSFATYQFDPDDRSTLQENHVSRLTESPAGDIWIFNSIGGASRLERRTGRIRYHQALADLSTLGLSSNDVLDISFSSSGEVWLGTANGLNGLAPGKDEWSHFSPPPRTEEELVNGSVSSLLIDSKNRIWCGGPGSLQCMEPDGKVLRRFDLEGTWNPAIAFLHEDANHRIWAVTSSGVFFRLDEETGEFASLVQARRRVRSIGFRKLDSSFEVDSQGRIWCLVQGGRPLRFDPEACVVEDPLLRTEEARFSFKGFVATEVLSDQNDDIWIATTVRGLYRYLGEEEKLLRYRHNPSDPCSLSGDQITSLFEDKGGILWIGSRGRGLNTFNRGRQEFLHIKHDPSRSESLPPAAVTALAEGKNGEIWIGTDGAGLHSFDPMTAKVTHHLSNPEDQGRLSSNNITAIHFDAKNRLWVGTDDSGLNRIDLDSQKPGEPLRSQRYLARRDRESLQSNVIQCMTGGQHGVWVGHGTLGGISHIDLETDRITNYPATPNDPNGLGGFPTWALLEENVNTLWIGGPGWGLRRMDPTTGKVFRYPWDPGDLTTLTDRTVNSLLLDRDGRLWAGTYIGGLNCLDRQSKTFTHFTRRDGLPSNMINSMVEDQAGRLWLATNRGLSRFDPATRKFRNFSRQDGLQGFEFSIGAAMMGRGGNILVGGQHGFNVFNPDRLIRNTRIPQVAITSFRKFDEELLRWGADLSKTTTLTHRDNFLSFEFAVLDYANPEGNQYRYRLLGFDDEWIEAGHRRYASYTNVPPGDYTFSVMGANSDGIWNRETVFVPFIILPPFWQTMWFRAAAFVLLVTVVISTHQFRVRRLETMNRNLEEAVEEKTSLLRSKNQELKALNEDKNELVRIAAHDMRTPLTSVGAYLGLTIDAMRQDQVEMDTAISDLEEAQGASERVAKLLSGMLDIAAVEDGRLQLEIERGSLEDLLLARCRFHRRLAEQKGIRFEFESFAHCASVQMDRDRIGEVLDNLLSNAIKYTFPGGKITVLVEPCDGQIVVKVRDTGQGLDEKDLENVFKSFSRLSARPTGGEASTGLGLAIVKKVVELHGGEVGVESCKSEGSTFFFSLPVDGEGLVVEDR